MTGAADLVPAPAGALEENPAEYMAVVLNRAKGWLAEAKRIEDVRDQKAYALTLETAIREKELGFDAQLSATEIVRRCERRIGELVRRGQAYGEITKRSDNRYTVRVPGTELVSPSSAAGLHPASKQTLSEHYVMAGTPSAQFDQAIAEAREEGNLSRANVVRKVKGEPIAEPRTKPAAPSLDTERGRTVAASHARRFTDLTHALAGYAEGINSLDIALIRAAMEPAELDEWTGSLGKSLTALRRLRTDLQGGRN